jgi:hypothetical protein
LTGGGVLVMQGVTLPAPNTCQPVAMYEAVGGTFAGAATGMICLDGTDNRTLVLQYTFVGCTADYFESGICRLQLSGDIGGLPTTSSTCRLTLGNGIFYREVNDAVISSCSASALPVPGGGGAQCFGTSPHRGEPLPPPSGGTRAK